MCFQTCQGRRETLFKRGTPEPARTGTGAGAARDSAPHGRLMRLILPDPDPPRMGRGQLLSGVRRQQENQSHSDKQSQEQTLHGLPSFFWACAAPSAGCNKNEGNRASPLYFSTGYPATFFRPSIGVPGTARLQLRVSTIPQVYQRRLEEFTQQMGMNS